MRRWTAWAGLFDDVAFVVVFATFFSQNIFNSYVDRSMFLRMYVDLYQIVTTDLTEKCKQATTYLDLPVISHQPGPPSNGWNTCCLVRHCTVKLHGSTQLSITSRQSSVSHKHKVISHTRVQTHAIFTWFGPKFGVFEQEIFCQHKIGILCGFGGLTLDYA